MSVHGSFFQFVTADGSKYCDNHKPQPTLLWNRSESERQIGAVENSEHFVTATGNKTHRHSC